MKGKYGDNPYKLQVVDQRSREPGSADGAVISGVYTFVYDAGTKTLATIYADGERTALANPITRAQFAADDCIKFWGAAESYDLVINDDKGNTGVYGAVAPETHTLPLETTGVEKCLVFPMVFNSGGTEVDTGLDLPKFCAVHDAQVEVVTTDATETVDIGTLTGETNADPNGFRAAASVANAGFVQPVTVTVGSNESFVAANTYGALLSAGAVGTDVNEDTGLVVRKLHYVAGSDAVSISYTPSSSDTFAGYGYVHFRIAR